MSKLDLLAIGEAMAELRRSDSDDFKVGFAGDTFNTAVYTARELSTEAKVCFFTRVGNDPLSADFIELAKKESLDASHIARDQEKLIGIYAVSTDVTGERSFSYWRSNSAARQLFSHDEAVHSLPAARITYLSGITLAIMTPTARNRLMAYLKAAASAGKTEVAFDSNYRPKLWENRSIAREIVSEMWEIADIALPSIDDEMELFGDDTEDAVIKRFSNKSWKACAIKRGVKGPFSPTISQTAMPVFNPAVRVVDTTAAGDSFNGGYLAAYLRGEDEAACLSNGHKTASYVVGHPGAIAPSS